MKNQRLLLPVLFALTIGGVLGCAATSPAGITGITLGGVTVPAVITHFHYWQPSAGGGSLFRSATANAKVSSAGFALMQAAPAPSSTIVMSFNGFCNTVPNPSNFSFGAKGFGVLVYGLGRLESQSCDQNFAYYDGTGISPKLGTPVVGAGSLTTLRAYSATPGSTATSGKIVVYINGVPSSLTCTIGTAARCADDTNAPTVNDNDLVAVSIQLQPGDNISDLRILFGKQ